MTVEYNEVKIYLILVQWQVINNCEILINLGTFNENKTTRFLCRMYKIYLNEIINKSNLKENNIHIIVNICSFWHIY